MINGGTPTLRKKNVSFPAPPLPLVERERPKTAVLNHSHSSRRNITVDTKRLIENGQQPIYFNEKRPSAACHNIPTGNVYCNMTVSSQVDTKNHQRLLPSTRSTRTQTIVGDVRQPAFLEAYQPAVIIKTTIVKHFHNHKRRKEKKKVDDPFNPEFCLQRQAAIDNMEYRKIIISWKATSLNEVIYLIKKLSMGKNLIDRAWIIFYWISQNIEYDVKSFFSGNISHQTANDVFRHKKGVCDAYATIFKALCDGVQLECVKLSGYAKGYSYVLGDSIFTRTNHSWNAIKINNQWYFVDSTWGSGHLDMYKKYHKKLNSHYFLTQPEYMIYDHFPENSKWQLLLPTISMEQFLLLPRVYSMFFNLQLEIASPQNTNMVTFDTNRALAEVLIRNPSDSRLLCSVAHDKTSGLVQYDIDRKLWQCLFRPRSSGYHTLNIYARQEQSTGSYEAAIEFGINMPDVKRFYKFPLIYRTFTDNKCQIFEPLARKLRRHTKVTIHCRIPGARCVCLSFDGTFSSQDHNLVNDIFKQEITVPDREVIVYVRFANKQQSNSYDGLFKYTVE